MKKKSIKINALLNTIKQICAVIFPMITFPYASRVLGKFYYGKVNFGASIISYIALIAALGVNNYAVREGARIRNDAHKLNRFSNEVFSINIISTIIAYFILIIIIAFNKNIKGYATLLIIQSLSVIFTTIGTDWINSINEDYTFITIRYIVCQLFSIIFMFIFVKSPKDYIFYAFSSVLGIILANAFNVIYIKNKYNIKIRFTIKMNLGTHLKPILILFGFAVASLIYINSDITILGLVKGDSDVGLYSVSAKIYTLAKSIINAMLYVTIPRISNLISKVSYDEINQALNKILGLLLIIVMPAFVGLFFLSKYIILLFAGNEFILATNSLRILSISLIFAIASSFFINVILIPYRKEKYVLLTTISSASVNIVLNIILIPKYGINAAATTTLLSEVITYILGAFFSRQYFKFNSFKEIFIGFINAVLTLICCLITCKILQNAIIIIVISIVFSLALCFLVVFIFDREKLEIMRIKQ